MADINSNLPTQDRSDGTPGSAVPSIAIQVGGTDGSNLRALKTDSGGNLVVQGLGSNGSPAGGVVSVQGVSSGTIIPTADKADGTTGAAVPGFSMQVAGSDGTNLRTLKTDTAGNLFTTSKTALTASSPTSATVGVTSAQAVASNASRKGLVLANTSAHTISFGIGASAVLNSGITLYPGGVWVMDEFTLSTGAVNAIAGAASSNLSIQEFT